MNALSSAASPARYLLASVAGLLTLGLVATLPANAGSSMQTSTKADIVDTAIAAGSFNTLVSAVQAAGLVETLKGAGPFTVFAPTDEAFSRIPEAQLQALLADKDALTAVLTYHVVPGKVMAADVAGLTEAATVQGESISIDTSMGVRVDGANVIQTDIETSNGVIHVIDSVILPDAVAAKLSAAPLNGPTRLALF